VPVPSIPATPPTPRDDDAPLFALAGVRQERGGRLVLDQIDLELPAGEVIALVGPSGAGKTSLLRLLDRLDDPIAGEVRFRGARLDAIPVRELRRRVGFVFQAPTMLAGTVAANLGVARELGASPSRHRAGPADDEAIAHALSLAGLDASYAERGAAGLSGGEQQRVSIARALMTRPEVLLLDEPTAALDPEVAERLMATVARLSREAGLGIVMVTHRLAEARQASTYAVMLESGRVVEAGPTAALFERPARERTREYLASAR
jgi:ABC-type methionine transport system ATPase subunit